MEVKYWPHTEPVIFFGTALAKCSLQNVYQLNYEYFAEQNGFNTSEKLDSYGCNNENYTIQQTQTQQDTVRWGRWCMIAYYCCALVSFLLFALSDKYGRKLVLLACVTGQLFYSAIHVVQFHYNLPLYFQIVANTINGLTGGQSVLLGVAFAGLADISQHSGSKYRTLRISIGELCIGFGGFICFEMNTLLIRYFNLWIALVGTCLLQVLLCFYIIFILTNRDQQFSDKTVSSSLVNKYKNSFRAYLRYRPNNGTIILWLLVGVYIFNVCRDIGQSAVLDLYEKNSPFCWTREQVSSAKSLTELVFAIGILLSILLQKLNSSETIQNSNFGKQSNFGLSKRDFNFYIITTGILVNIISSFLYGFSEFYKSSYMLYSAIIVPVILAPAITPLIKSEWLEFCSNDEHGAVFGVPTLIMQVSTGLAGIFYQSLYEIIFGGVFFVLSAGFDCLSLVLFLVACFLITNSGKQ